MGVRRVDRRVVDRARGAGPGGVVARRRVRDPLPVRPGQGVGHHRRGRDRRHGRVPRGVLAAAAEGRAADDMTSPGGAVAAADGLDAGELFEALVTTGVVLWLAHAFAAAVGRAVADGRHLELPAVLDCMRDELGLLVGFLVPLPAIALGIFDLLGDARAADVAIGVLLGLLLVVGTVLGRLAGMGFLSAVLMGLAYPALGAAVILLEVAVKH